MARTQPNATDLMQQILGSLNADPQYLAGFNSGFVNDANNLYQGLASQLAGVDQQRALANVDYTRKLSDLAASQAQAEESLRNRMASRGILQSSIMGDEMNKLAQSFDTQRSDLGSGLNQLLASLTGQQTGFENQYDVNLGQLEQGLTNQASTFVNQRAQEQRDRDLAKQQADAQAALQAQQTAALNKQTAVAAPPPVDLSPLIAAFTQTQTPPAPQGGWSPPPGFVPFNNPTPGVAAPPPGTTPKKVVTPGYQLNTSTTGNPNIKTAVPVKKNPWF